MNIVTQKYLSSILKRNSNTILTSKTSFQIIFFLNLPAINNLLITWFNRLILNKIILKLFVN
jgi:hypothetical protein